MLYTAGLVVTVFIVILSSFLLLLLSKINYKIFACSGRSQI